MLELQIAFLSLCKSLFPQGYLEEETAFPNAKDLPSKAELDQLQPPVREVQLDLGCI